jgi:nucleoside-diphosphate-sugar epimerase
MERVRQVASAALSPYGASKRAAMEYLKTYEHLCGLEWTALTFANVYGPHQTTAPAQSTSGRRATQDSAANPPYERPTTPIRAGSRSSRRFARAGALRSTRHGFAPTAPARSAARPAGCRRGSP